MGHLLSILRDVGLSDLPTDWRTVVNRCNVHDFAVSHHADGDRASSIKTFDVLTLDSGACWLAPFSDDVLEASVTCETCGIATVKCPRPLCRERCILVERLGKRSVETIKPCSVCMISSTSFYTHRTYHWSLEKYIRDAFADPHHSVKFLFPFRNHFDHVSNPSGQSQLFFKHSWYEDWLHSIQSSPVSTQLFHGERFYSNPIWTEHGPRSLIILLSLDWFPPFKSSDYSVGVLTATVANLSTAERAARENT
jgi:hypothetical protein